MTFDAPLQSATHVATSTGRQYHIGLRRGDVARNIILVGDPARAQRFAQHFAVMPDKAQTREFVSYTGNYNGIDITVLGTGIGAAATEIALLELLQCVDQPVVIRCGSCGALQPEIGLGDLVISSGALRLEETTAAFVEPAYPAVAHYQVVAALLQAAAETAVPHHLGLTATAPGFYGAQGRAIGDMPLRTRERIASLREQKVANLEMETSCVLTLAGLAKARAGAVCAVYATRYDDRFIDPDTAQIAENHAIVTTLRAIEILSELDHAQGKARYWTPLHSALAKGSVP